jgi:predicted nucleotidyltransferase component of viral defense system
MISQQKNMSILYTKFFDKDRKKIFKKLSSFDDNFVLAGGTAIMLQISHRISYDFDCFSDKPLNRKLLRECRQVFGDKINIQVDNSDLLLFTTSEGVKVDFVYFPYPKISEHVKGGSLPLFGLRDLAANKAYTIGRRATWRDYVDMFFLLRKFDLDKIILDAQKKFKGEFSEKLFLEQLVYFKDLEVIPVEFIQQSYSDKD